ncbi:hypothetical protein CRI93_14985 [Longimonas halophila]|uniref:Uncharacterized protein n=1 Tax=Longimonas halophila TaxID=1469170 RepID=A0A2H3NHS2_9BACT|nr:hypothetical protein [Longimonas halophila]PEN04366.1 hypothetical protein CRI93_14985 [Longimonas halophila]
MTWLTKLRDRYLNASVEATAHYTKVWGECTHCATHTPWMARPARGYYKCLECGQHPLDAHAQVSSTAAAHDDRPPQHERTAPSSARQPA